MSADHAEPDDESVLVVIPTYDEADNVEEVLRRARHALPHADILVVDDNSPDGTAELAAEVGRRIGHVEILHRERKGGLGAAYRAGFAWGLERQYEILVEMDADLSHQPEELRSIVSQLGREDADLVIGSRYVPGGSIPSWPWHRRALSRWGNRYASSMLHLPVTDATSGFRAYRAGALRGASFKSSSATGYAFQIELAYRVARWGGRISEVPIVFTDRVKGRSKMAPWIAGEALALVTAWSIRERIGRLRDRILRRGAETRSDRAAAPSGDPAAR